MTVGLNGVSLLCTTYKGAAILTLLNGEGQSSLRLLF